MVPNLSIDGGCAMTMNNGHSDGDRSKGFCCLNKVMRSCVVGVVRNTETGSSLGKIGVGSTSKGFCCLNEVMRSCVAGAWSETLGLVQVWVKCGWGQPGWYPCAQNG